MNATATQDRAVYWGTGRRKSSIARVRLVPGSGNVVVNDRPGTDYFNRIPGYIVALKSPLETLGLEGEYDILVNAHGGGLTGQADAVKLGVARALCQLDPDNRQPLKIEGYLTRDPRCKERKKYGLHKARKAPQFSKR
jgi:small subunit ribosomal protein S9